MLRQNVRQGLSLTEALMAVFILAIGLISVMALFPLAAANMAQAFKDERTGQLASNADNFARIMWQQAWVDPVTGQLRGDGVAMGTTAVGSEPAFQALDNPGAPTNNPLSPGNQALTPAPPLPVFQGNEPTPSWPVYVDPIGVVAQALNGTNNVLWVAGQVPQAVASLGPLSPPLPGVPRRTLMAVPGTQRAVAGTSQLVPGSGISLGSVQARVRLCSLMDDLSFTPGGDTLNTTGTVERGERYNCAWLFQRLRNNVRSEVNVHVVVYQNRSADSAAQEIALPVNDTSNPSDPSVINPGTTAVVVQTNGAKLPFRKGTWVMIAGFGSVPSIASSPPNPSLFPVAEFYRLLGTSTPPAGPSFVQLEFQSPVRNTVGPIRKGTVFLLDGVVEVFDRGTISAVAPAAP